MNCRWAFVAFRHDIGRALRFARARFASFTSPSEIFFKRFVVFVLSPPNVTLSRAARRNHRAAARGLAGRREPAEGRRLQRKLAVVVDPGIRRGH
jgi:hypothetical protein